jgi:adenosylhomocysteine nucleosidase
VTDHTMAGMPRQESATAQTRRAGTLIVICGLLAEARLAAGRNVFAIASSGNSARLAVDIDRAIADGGGALLSFGIAGGLAPGLATGTVIIASSVVSGREIFATTAGWTRQLRAMLPNSVQHAVAGVDAPAASAAAKKALYASTNAAAVDMESHVAARAAARAGLPFAVVRAIADPAERALPQAAVAGLGNDGRPDLAAVLRALARHPGELAALIRVAADARRAMAALKACTSLLAPGFGLPPAKSRLACE